jgi:ribonuclease G
VLRDIVNESTQHPHRFARAVRDAARPSARVYASSSSSKLQHYKGERPIFDLYNIEEEIARRLRGAST